MGYLGELKEALKYKEVRKWSIFLLAVMAIVGSYMIYFAYENTYQEFDTFKYEIAPNETLTPGEMAIPDSAQKVYTGIYVDRIKSASLKDNIYSADFYIWFKWTGDRNPGDNFQVSSGTIEKKELINNSTNGDEKSALYKVSATISDNSELFRFPEDDQLLLLNIQDKSYGREELVYVPDNESSGNVFNVILPGYHYLGLIVAEKPLYYDSTMGNNIEEDTTFSQFSAGMFFSREELTVLLFSLIGSFAAVFAALISLTIPYKNRYTVSVSALFVGIVNMVLITGLVPNGVITIAHLISSFGLFIIILTLLESIAYHRFEYKSDRSKDKGENDRVKRYKKVSKMQDKVSLLILATGYFVTVSTIIIIAWFNPALNYLP
jgi:hypothetical protein